MSHWRGQPTRKRRREFDRQQVHGNEGIAAVIIVTCESLGVGEVKVCVTGLAGGRCNLPQRTLQVQASPSRAG